MNLYCLGFFGNIHLIELKGKLQVMVNTVCGTYEKIEYLQ